MVPAKFYGFVVDNDGESYFFHGSALEAADVDLDDIIERVTELEFDVVPSRKHPDLLQATNIEVWTHPGSDVR